MKTLIKLTSYEIKNLIRSKWLIAYSIFFLLMTESLFRFSGEASRVLISLLNFVLLLVPVVSILFSSLHIYNSREFTELLLSQPLSRKMIFRAKYSGLALPTSLIYIIGLGLPWIIRGFPEFSGFIGLIISSVMLNLIFCSIGILIALKFSDRSVGIGVSFIIWLIFAVIYDGLLLYLVYNLSEYPLEKFMIIVSSMNPIDTARINILLKLDTAALFGYTGAVYEKYFGTYIGTLTSTAIMLTWTIVPLLLSSRRFRKMDF